MRSCNNQPVIDLSCWRLTSLFFAPRTNSQTKLLPNEHPTLCGAIKRKKERTWSFGPPQGRRRPSRRPSGTRLRSTCGAEGRRRSTGPKEGRNKRRAESTLDCSLTISNTHRQPHCRSEWRRRGPSFPARTQGRKLNQTQAICPRAARQTEAKRA